MFTTHSGTAEQSVAALSCNPFFSHAQYGYVPVGLPSSDPTYPWYLTPAPWFRAHPDPSPWAVAFLVSAVSAKEAAAAMSNKEAASRVIATAEAAISQFIDDYCGTPPRQIPWPFPGPPPWVSVIASQITVVANTFQEGNLRSALTQIAGQLLDKASVAAPRSS